MNLLTTSILAALTAIGAAGAALLEGTGDALPTVSGFGGIVAVLLYLGREHLKRMDQMQEAMNSGVKGQETAIAALKSSEHETAASRESMDNSRLTFERAAGLPFAEIRSTPRAAATAAVAGS
jgi:hypothetical protein